MYIFLDTKSHLTLLPYLDMIVWSQLNGLENAFDGNCFEFVLSKGNIIVYFAGKYQLFGEH